MGAVTYAATESIAYGRTPSVLGIATAGVTSGVLAGGTKSVSNFVESKSLKILKIGRLEASNHKGNPQLGVKYQINKANGRSTIKSIEFHYNHSHNGYRPHWQLNSWNPVHGSIAPRKHWSLWLKRI